MDDTSKEMNELFHQMIMNLSEEERFIRGALMFDAAREMVLASFPPGLTEDEIRRRLYERFYGEPLPS